ncbi:putative S-adenosylmethionine-dependent [Ordospora colligata]|uniref:tRNA (guanine-N(7)-)-methyltransferase n=1 Tax=Ordospora colligata OC4 TaxID=1354746 RepID=A0A0B2UHV0_9MICR|nr:putative S-adenosylmethionine-dependent [Ordospora colligata OC4]KHN68918.1 putative S-adenosylmethionine-dependent [Ordospora colligata OC4]TBU13952.1 putative S-adenosylmethionine-dependent [Ordospora colligata]TBU14141.1 putative S-adenosylmethionine-dependent [Ordospora colligata]TBU17810.1 putative S-adenosylmethionine-dependent [Ordospora colligata]
MQPSIKKRDYRQRAHANPFKDNNIDIPSDPQSVDWTKYFYCNISDDATKLIDSSRKPDFVDIGCGYGKFLLKVAAKHPEHHILGIELRDKVHDYVKTMISSMNVLNAGIMKTNAMIFLPNIFEARQLSKVFVLFPDPHFKKRKWKGRVVSPQMMEVYEYLLMKGGRLYISTDVEELFNYMDETIVSSRLFRPLSEDEAALDEMSSMISRDTDEAGRAGAKSGKVFSRVFEVNKE